MKPKPQDKQTVSRFSRWEWIAGCGVTLLCFVFHFATQMPLPVVFGMSILCWIWVRFSCEFEMHSDLRHLQKQHRREKRKMEVREKQARNLEAQLRKPDFESRLSTFVKSNASTDPDEEFTSTMEFWQRSEQYSRTPTRPIELLRYLLQRISKIVGRD